MKFKEVPVSSSISVFVPENLSPDEEAEYIASRIAFVDFEQLEADSQEILQLWKEGKMIPMEDVLKDLPDGNVILMD